MNSKYWTDAQTCELIQLLENNECLWNASCPQYRDRTKRSLALAKMAIKLKHSAKQIRTKIKNLRSQYNTFRIKMKKTSSKKSLWKYYTSLHFMFDNANDINYDDAMDVKVSGQWTLNNVLLLLLFVKIRCFEVNRNKFIEFAFDRKTIQVLMVTI